MTYFDSDVLINYLVVQSLEKHTLATELYREATQKNHFFISILTLQEVSHVLARLQVSQQEITRKIKVFMDANPAHCDLTIFSRACILAEKIGFRHVNDCMHTAIAETYCTELYTFNESDFKKIKRLADVKVVIF